MSGPIDLLQLLSLESGDDDIPERARTLLGTMFSSLRELYVFCETHQRADIGGEVVDALSMCQEDFSVLVDRLRRRGEKSGSSSGGNIGPRLGGVDSEGMPLSIILGAPNMSPLASSFSSPLASPSASPNASPNASSLAQLDSPESNSRMLAALEALELEELQEASRYFEVAGPMLPRKAHEALYLERASAEGRESAARRFLVTLGRMASAANAQRRSADGGVEGVAPNTAIATQRVVAESALSSTVHLVDAPEAILGGLGGGRDDVGIAHFALPPSVGSANDVGTAASTELSGGGERGGDGEGAEDGWEQPKQKRRSRRRRLWDEDGNSTATVELSPSAADTSDGCGGEDLSRGREFARGILESSVPPQDSDEVVDHTEVMEKGSVAMEGVFGDSSPPPAGPHSNAPLPAWTSWTDAMEDRSERGSGLPGLTCRASLAVPLGADEGDSGHIARMKSDTLSPLSFVLGSRASPTVEQMACKTEVKIFQEDGQVASAAPAVCLLRAAESEMDLMLLAGAAIETSGGACVIDMPAKAWSNKRSFASVVRGKDLDAVAAAAAVATAPTDTTAAGAIVDAIATANAFEGKAARSDALAAYSTSPAMSAAGGYGNRCVIFAASLAAVGGDDYAELPSPSRRRLSAVGSVASSTDSAGRQEKREKLLSPDRRSAEELHEIQMQRELKAEAMRAARAADEAEKLLKRREREAQVRKRQEEMKEERKAAIQARMSKADGIREAHIGKVASRARLESRKVDEIAFIKSMGTDPVDELAEDKKERMLLKMSEAEERRKLQIDKQAAARAEKDKAKEKASERLNQTIREGEARGNDHASRVDEAYQRWSDFTQSVADRAAQRSKQRADASHRRELAELEEAAEKKRALEQRIAEANERRLAHIQMLMLQARVVSERSAQAQQTREARKATWADEANSATDGVSTADRRSTRSDNELLAALEGGVACGAERERSSRKSGGGRKCGRHGSKRHRTHSSGGSLYSESGCSSYSVSGDEGGGGRSRGVSVDVDGDCREGMEMAAEVGTGGEHITLRRPCGGASSLWDRMSRTDNEDEDAEPEAEEIADQRGCTPATEGDQAAAACATAADGAADYGSRMLVASKTVVVAVPPTLAALAAKDDVDDSSNLATSGGAASGSGVAAAAYHLTQISPALPNITRVHDLVCSPLRAQVQAAEAEAREAERERLRKLRARAKKVRQRMAATASSLRIEHLEQLWGGAGSAQGSKRILKLLAELATLAMQPYCDGAETCAWELCRLLETGRERDLHTVRTQGGLESLVTLAMAGVADAAGAAVPFSTSTAAPPQVRASTKTAAVRALLAACALPQNRAYLLLTSTVERLAFGLLPAAIDMDSRQEQSESRLASPITVSAPPDALLLPLLKVLRLVIATPPVAEAGCKLRADLVVVVLYSGGLHLLREYCTAQTLTLSGAARHQPLLIQYFALLHALLLPVHADNGSPCAAPLHAYLEESGLCGVPEMVTNILFESTQPAGSQPQPTAELSASGIASGLTVPVIKVCRTAIQLLVHIGSLGAEGGGGGPSAASGAGFLRRILGSEELRINTFQLSHLTLSLFEAVERAHSLLGCASSGGSCASETTSPQGRFLVDEIAVSIELRSLLHEVLLLLGIFALRSPRNAEALRWRYKDHPTMLHRLVGLPFRYFCDPQCKLALFPTLLCAVLHESVNLRILTSRLSPEHLLTFLRTEMLARQSSVSLPGERFSDYSASLSSPAVLVEDPSELPMVSLEYALAARMPPSLWQEAVRYLAEEAMAR